MTAANSCSVRKECLTDWRAPGHIPWGNTPDHTTSNDKWLPEGSLYSPEDFSRALHQARRRAVYARVDTEQDSCAIVDTSFDKYTTATERMDSGISSGTLTHTELVDIIMRELKDLENFFEGTSQEVVHPEQLTLPSLMISNSHCTFPLSLDSCQSFTLKPPSLADRRGRKPLPPLLLKNEIPSPELSYTGIPTAFLSSPSLYSPKFQDVDLANTPELRIEDMIKNLRLQCSSMTPNTPPADISWNSPSCPTSPMPAHEPIKTSMEPEVVEFAGPTIGSTSFSANNTSSEINSRRLVTLTIPTRRASLSGVEPEVLPKRTSSPHPLLRSSLVKQENFRPKSLKSVRFALSPSEFEKNVASLRYDDVWRSSQNPICYSMVPTIFYDNMDKAETQENDSPQRSLQSGGRYSLGLSRIIKGPIFSGKEHKKAATISTRWEFNEKGNAVRDSTESIQKKSGMPVPLRNILTRFK